MFHWIPYAFVRIVVFFVAGIVTYLYWPNSISITNAIGLFLVLITGYVIIFIHARIFRKTSFNPGFIGLMAIFMAGYINVFYHTDANKPNQFINLDTPVDYYKVVVNRYADEKEKSWKVEARILMVKPHGEWKACEGKVLLYFPKQDFKTPYHYGDVLLIKGRPSIVPPPQNPGEFDYQRFLRFKNIYHQHFVKKQNVVFINNSPPNSFIYYAIASRLWANQELQKNFEEKRERSIASALVLGVTDGLDNELLNAYASTGAMHVLAVSGLHVGILYWLILTFFKPLKKTVKGRWALAIMSVIILWCYAFITGLSPSVLRAVTMFSFFAIAQPLNQRTNIYNILAVSAFCILVYDPFLIMSVGFQLSYLAVLGIVYLHPSLYRLWEPNNKLYDEAWKITSVSIAAQVATFALGLLYFHQFPNYFLLSNLFVIPLSFVVLLLGLAILAFNFIASIATVLDFGLTWIIKLLNYIVFTVEAFPFSLLENVYITTFQCWILVLIVLSIILFIQYKKVSYGWLTVLLIGTFAMAGWYHFNTHVDQQRITLYKVSGHSAFDLIDRGQTFFFTDSNFYNNTNKIRFHISPNRLQCGVAKVFNGGGQPFVQALSGGRLITWKSKAILQITDSNFVAPQHLTVDYLIISNNAVKDIHAMVAHVKATTIIIDSSNSFTYANRLYQSKRAELPIHSIWHQGAFDELV